MLFQVHVEAAVQDVIIEADDMQGAIKTAVGEVNLAEGPGRTFIVTALGDDETQVQFTESSL